MVSWGLLMPGTNLISYLHVSGDYIATSSVFPLSFSLKCQETEHRRTYTPCTGIHIHHAQAYIYTMHRRTYTPCTGIHIHHAQAYIYTMHRRIDVTLCLGS